MSLFKRQIEVAEDMTHEKIIFCEFYVICIDCGHMGPSIYFISMGFRRKPDSRPSMWHRGDEKDV